VLLRMVASRDRELDRERSAALQTTPLYIEKATRSHLGGVKDGELIFLFDARSEQPGAMGAAPR